MKEIANRRAVIEQALEESREGMGPVYLRFQTKCVGVQFPASRHIDEDGFVTIKLSMRYAVPPVLQDDVIEANVRLEGSATEIVIPYKSIVAAIRDGTAVLWFQLGDLRDDKPPSEEEKVRQRPAWLRVINGGD